MPGAQGGSYSRVVEDMRRGRESLARGAFPIQAALEPSKFSTVLEGSRARRNAPEKTSSLPSLQIPAKDLENF